MKSSIVDSWQGHKRGFVFYKMQIQKFNFTIEPDTATFLLSSNSFELNHYFKQGLIRTCHKMVKHTETIYRLLVDELFECVCVWNLFRYPFSLFTWFS